MKPILFFSAVLFIALVFCPLVSAETVGELPPQFNAEDISAAFNSEYYVSNPGTNSYVIEGTQTVVLTNDVIIKKSIVTYNKTTPSDFVIAAENGKTVTITRADSLSKDKPLIYVGVGDLTIGSEITTGTLVLEGIKSPSSPLIIVSPNGNLMMSKGVSLKNSSAGKDGIIYDYEPTETPSTKSPLPVLGVLIGLSAAVLLFRR
ncbi:MAG: hypothetical protein Q4Q53_02495 [Methanocorpusculum sp.]|nr:hypothetical protein [Methanocorpusculum sp.]